MDEANEKKMLRILHQKLASNPDIVPRCGNLPIWDISSIYNRFVRHLLKFVFSELAALEISFMKWAGEADEIHLSDWRKTPSGGGFFIPGDLSVDYFYKIESCFVGWVISKRESMESSEDHHIAFGEACASYDKLVQSNMLLNITCISEFNWYWLFVHPKVL